MVQTSDSSATIAARQSGVSPIAGCACTFLALAIGSVFALFVGATVVAWSLLLIGATSQPLVYRALSGALDLFEPIQLISAVFALNFAVRAIFIVQDPVLYPRLGLYPYDDALPAALMYAFAGFVALCVGYGLAGALLKKFRRPALRPWPDRPPIAKLVVLALVGAAASLVLIRTGGAGAAVLAAAPVGDSTFVLGALSQFVNFAAAIAALYLADPRQRANRLRLICLLGGVLLPASVLQSFVFGSKSRLLITLFAVIAAFNYAGRQRIRLRTVAITGAIVLLVFFPALNAYRVGKISAGATKSVGRFVDSLAQLGHHLSEGGWSTLSAGPRSLVLRSHGVDSLSLVIKYGRRFDLAHPRDYLLMPAYAFVPRAIWPTKPVNATAVRFVRAFLLPPGFSGSLATLPSLGIFHIGDLYVSFGVVGMLMGLFVLGGLYRTLYWRYNPNGGTDRRGIFMFVILLWMVVNGFESDVPTVYANILKTMTILWAVAFFVGVRAQDLTVGLPGASSNDAETRTSHDARHVTRLFVVSHTYTEPANRQKWRAFREIDPDCAITVITPSQWGDSEFGRLVSPAEAADGLEFIPMRAVRWRTSAYLIVAPRLIAELRRMAPQVIYVESEPWSPVYLQLALLRRLLVPSARMAVFSWWNTPRWNTPLRFPGFIAYRAGCRATSLLIAGNRDAAVLHARHGFSGPVRVAPQLGIDPGIHTPGPADPDLTGSLGLRYAYVIGFAGRLTAAKGVDILVRAAARLDSGDWKVLLVGRGIEEERLRALAAELGIAQRLVFAGSVRRADMPRYLRLMDVLVLPSREEQWEQFGYVLIEAMACGVPVIGSTSGEIPRVIGNYDLIFPMDDVDELTRRLARLRHDREYAAACRAAGFARVHSRYTQQAIAKQLHAALNDISDKD